MAIQPVEAGMIVHQVLDVEGNLVGDMPDLSTERLLALYRAMLLGRAFRENGLPFKTTEEAIADLSKAAEGKKRWQPAKEAK